MDCRNRFRAALLLMLNLYITTGNTFKSQKFTLSSQSPPALRAPSPNTHAKHVLSLTAKPGTSKSSGYLQSLRNGNHSNGVYGLTPVNYVASDAALTAYLQIGTQSFQAQIDTGSSDTWVIGQNFQCLDGTTQAPEPESVCNFGPAYTISPTFKRIRDENFHISYGDGTTETGIYGKEKVTIAGIPVQNQQIAVVDHAAEVADGETSGLIGLAFPSTTAAYAGTDPTKDTERIPYNPILTNMFSKGYVAPVFSLALKRSSITSGVAAGGLFAIGGLPPVGYGATFASAPFQLLNVDFDGNPVAVPQYQFYTIIIDGFTYERSNETKWSHPILPNPLTPPTDPSQHQVIVDSGTTLTYVPTGIADAVNALFDPPAVKNNGYYAVNCSAKAPEFGVVIGAQTFYINGQDLMTPTSVDGTCASGISDAGSGMSVLGTVFLRNVLAVFDVGASEMRFAAREFY